MNWTNNLKEIEALLTKLRSTSSTNDKKSILEQELLKPAEYQEFLKQVLLYTYSPKEVFFFKPLKIDDVDLSERKINKLYSPETTMLDLLHAFQTTLKRNDGIEAYLSHKEMCSKNGREFENELLDCILNKDLRAGIATSTINKVFNNLIPEYPYMRCSTVKQITKPEEWLDENTTILVQEKMDGMFINLTVANDIIEVASRQGSVFPDTIALDGLKSVAQYLPEGQYHGELLVVDKNTKEYLPREIGNGILLSIAKASKSVKSKFNPDEHELQFVSWDYLSLDRLKEIDEMDLGYKERLIRLENNINDVLNNIEIDGTLPIKVIDTVECSNVYDATELFKQALQNGKEGVCWKLPNMIWNDETSKRVIKLKNEFEIDVEIKGFIPGNGKNESTFGSIRTESSDGKLVVDVSGFKDEMRQHIWDNRDDYIGKIMSIKASLITKTNDEQYSLFLPRFVEMREDKFQADDFDRIQQQYEESLSQYNPAIALENKMKEKQEKSKKKKMKI